MSLTTVVPDTLAACQGVVTGRAGVDDQEKSARVAEMSTEGSSRARLAARLATHRRQRAEAHGAVASRWRATRSGPHGGGRHADAFVQGDGARREQPGGHQWRGRLMARHLRPCTAQLYDAATRWRIDCLDSDGSLLSTGRSVWTADVLEELAGCLVVSADEREGSFITKLKAQLADASADAVQLTAELHIVHFLIWWTEGSGSISYATKRSQLDEILSWRPDSPAVPDQVDELLRCGIVRMGQHALSKRYTQLNYLIQLARTWKRLPSADKRTYATDPWSFRELAETIDAPSSDAQRLAIQYLLF